MLQGQIKVHCVQISAPFTHAPRCYSTLPIPGNCYYNRHNKTAPSKPVVLNEVVQYSHKVEVTWEVEVECSLWRFSDGSRPEITRAVLNRGTQHSIYVVRMVLMCIKFVYVYYTNMDVAEITEAGRVELHDLLTAPRSVTFSWLAVHHVCLVAMVASPHSSSGNLQHHYLDNCLDNC